MDYEYIVILRASSTDVTALKELGYGTSESQLVSNSHLPEFDQLIVRFRTSVPSNAALVSLLARRKIVWFQRIDVDPRVGVFVLESFDQIKG